MTDHKNDDRDKAITESFLASVKKELVHRKSFRTHAQAEVAIFEYFEVDLPVWK